MSEPWIRVLTVVCLLSLVGAGYAQEQSQSAQAQQAAGQAQQRAAGVVAEPEAPRVILPAETTASVLRLMKFSGALKDRMGNPRSGAVGLTFALYKDQQGGSPLWLEVHNAQLDEQGRYTVLLGNTKNEGLPLELFSSGEARWLGVQVQLPGEEEQARVLLVSVPYAMKAADAETLGGKPPSAFVLAESREGAAAQAEVGKEAVKEGPGREQVVGPISGEGTPNFLAKFTGANAIANSVLFESAGNVGLGTTSPLGQLDVATGGTTDLRVRNTSGQGLLIRAWTSGMNLDPVASGGNFFFGRDVPLSNFAIQSGNVGIGTATPTAKLEVAGGLKVDSTTLAVDAVTDRVGIGTTGPLGQLDVATGGTTDLLVRNTSGQGLLIRAWALGMNLDPVASGGNFFFGRDVPLSNFAIQSGNVGIGTATPSQKLEVAGTLKLSGGTGIIFPDSTVQMTAGGGDITAVNPGTGLTGGGLAGDVTLSLSAASRVRAITYLAGCDSCGALVDADDQKTIYMNLIGTMTIDSVTCFSDTGTPSINLQRDDGTPANILSVSLSCPAAGISSTSFVGVENVLNLNDKLDFVMVTAGGAAKRVTVIIKATLN